MGKHRVTLLSMPQTQTPTETKTFVDLIIDADRRAEHARVAALGRARALTPTRRQEIARKAAQARWLKQKQKDRD